MTVPAAPHIAVATGRSKALRVWLVGDFAAARAGNHSVAEDLARRLAQRGLVVGTTSNRDHRVARVLDMGWQTWRRVGSIDVAVVDVYSGPAFRWAELVVGVLWQRRVPTVLVLRGGSLPKMAERSPARVRRLFSKASAVVALSGYLAERMADHSDRIRSIPNPLDTSAYTFRLRTSATPRLVWLRTFSETYNPPLAVDVLARVRERFPDASLIMVGRDKRDGTAARARALAKELGVEDAVEFVGAVPKSAVPEQMQRGDVLLNTPRIDNTPISVLEALATGLCVVSTDVGGLPYLLQHEKDALLVPTDDARAMSEAVIRICERPDLAERLSRNARETALRHDWTSVLPRWEELLSEVAAGGTV